VVDSRQQLTLPITIAFRGTFLAAPSANNTNLFGLLPNTTGSSPFVSAVIVFSNDGAGSIQRFRLLYNSAGSLINNAYVPELRWPGAGVPVTVVAVLRNGRQTMYLNGTYTAQNVQAASNPTYTSTANVAFGDGYSTRNANCSYEWGAIWNAELLDEDIALLQVDPYAMLRSPTSWRIIAAHGAGGGQTLAPPLLTNTSILYAPTVSGGVVLLSPPLIASTQVIYIPTVTPGAVTLNPPLIASTATLYAPTVTPGAVTLSPPLLTNTSTLYAPTVTVAGGLSPPLLTNTSTLFTPTITTGAVTLSPPLIASTVVLYAPVVLGNQLNPPLIVSTTTLYAPTLTVAGVTLAVGFLTSGTVLFPPVLLITIPDVSTTRYSQEIEPGTGVEYSILTSRSRT
jgi:hypothetical protein